MKTIFSILFLLLSISCLAQKKGIILNEFTHFQLAQKKDTIDFVIADTSFSAKKPVFLFCQGSQPLPLFLDFGEQGIFPAFFHNFDIAEMKKNYHVVFIAMPKTPVVAGMDHLNRSYNYVADTAREYSYLPEYLKADYSENYVNRANAVLRYLQKQKWVDAEKLIVAGHSQGARIAVGIAVSNKKVTKLGLLGYNPMGRIDQLIRQPRKDAEQGKISWEKADTIQQEQYDFYRLIQNEDSLKADPYLRSWKSFSERTVDKLASLKIPVYIAYGSADIVADFCDLLPLYFIEKGKTDYVVKRYPNLEHNFFPIRSDGTPDYEKGEWKSVLNAFVKWTL